MNEYIAVLKESGEREKSRNTGFIRTLGKLSVFRRQEKTEFRRL